MALKLATSALDSLLRDAVAEGLVPGLVAAVSDRDGPIYELACGAARAESGMDMRVDSVVRIASMSKIVTSLAVLMLCEEGELQLDAPLAEHLPGYRQPGVLVSFDDTTLEYTTRDARSAITIRQLLTHTSGYGYWFLDERLCKLSKGTPELFAPPFLTSEPGTRFAYSTSTDMLGLLFEPVTGRGLGRFFAERILTPLGMCDTGYALPADRDRLAAVHAHRGQSYSELPIEQRVEGERGGGGLFSTARDYLRLLRMFLRAGELEGRRLLSAAGIAAMTHNQIGDLYAEPQATAFPERSNDFIFMDGSQKFGFGFMIETEDRPTGRRAGSLSWAGIVNTYFWLDPETGLAAVLLMQTSPFADSVCVDLYTRFERAVYDALA